MFLITSHNLPTKKNIGGPKLQIYVLSMIQWASITPTLMVRHTSLSRSKFGTYGVLKIRCRNSEKCFEYLKNSFTEAILPIKHILIAPKNENDVPLKSTLSSIQLVLTWTIDNPKSNSGACGGGSRGCSGGSLDPPPPSPPPFLNNLWK